MKKFKKILFVIILILVYMYVCNITMFPSSIILMQGEALNLNTVLGLNVKNTETITASSNLNNSILEETGKINLELNLFNLFSVKDVTINVIPKTTVIPLGKAIGMKMYTKGVLVVGMSEIEGNKPYENSGIQTGDKIIEINNKKINNTEELIECVNSSNGKSVQITYISDNKEEVTNILPVKTGENEYKLGLWVRDAAAGVGTASFYDIETGKIAALGHGITDVDTGDLVTISNGELITTNVLSISKGEEGEPGEIRGTIEGGNKIGNVEKNTSLGIFGEVSGKNYLGIKDSDAIDVANRNEIKEGKAYIICELETGKKGKYEIEIEKIYTANNHDNKSMLIKITDSTLLEKTGGIIQGMSGSPIIQNGKLIGAVTHVLVNNPTEGYAVFADMMLKQMKSVE